MADDTRDGGSSTSTQVGEQDAAALASAVLEEESKREAEQIARSTQQLLPDDLLPGVGADQMSFKDAVSRGGLGMLALIPLLGMVEEFDRVAIAVLAPDIQKTLNVSDTVLIISDSHGVLCSSVTPRTCGSCSSRSRNVAMVTFVVRGLFSMMSSGSGIARKAVRRMSAFCSDITVTVISRKLAIANCPPTSNVENSGEPSRSCAVASAVTGRTRASANAG